MAMNGSPPAPAPSPSASTGGDSAGISSRTAPPLTPAPPLPSVPDHDLLRIIGQGAYGEVWLARSALGTWRAVKLVRRAAFDDERPYEREFAGLQKFEPISRTHDGFVDLLQVGRNDAEGWFYYVMELADSCEWKNAEGRMQKADVEPPASSASSFFLFPFALGTYVPLTLSSSVKLHGARPLDGCLRIARTLTSALAELHRHGLVHRDIKPSNIIFVDGVPKLADVGLVAMAKGVGQDRSFVGTEGFIPLEGPGTSAADLYSLGIVLYVLATGKSHRDFPEPPADLATRPDRERWLEFSAIIHRAAAADPKQRYGSATAMLADLERLQVGKSVRQRRAYLRWVKWTATVAGSAVIAGL
jgi:serine/threonine protein kinase